jgi:hypothetical protein
LGGWGAGGGPQVVEVSGNVLRGAWAASATALAEAAAAASASRKAAPRVAAKVWDAAAGQARRR